jgi:hypothetical protein
MMSGNQSAGARILAAHARLYEQTAADLAAGRAAGLPADQLADLEAQDLAARNRYQELSVDLTKNTGRFSSGSAARGRRPWWRFW